MQVTEDQRLLRQKVKHLSGDAGIERMECALSETRSRYFKVKENRSPLGSPMTQSFPPSLGPTNFSPSLSMVSSSSEENIPVESNQTSRVVRSLFKNPTTAQPGGSSISAISTTSDGQLGSSIEKLVTNEKLQLVPPSENEVLVNEFLHEHHRSLSDGFGNADHDKNSIEVSASL